MTVVDLGPWKRFFSELHSSLKVLRLSRQKFNENALLNKRVHLVLRLDAANKQSALASWTDLLPSSTLHPHPTYIKASRYLLHLGSVKKERSN